MTSPKVIFVNRFYWPDEPATAQLLTDLAEGLTAKGFSVTVLSSAQSPAVPLRETRNGVEIVRVRTTHWGKWNLLGRALDFATFLRGARRFLRRELRASDVVVTMTDPPHLGPSLASIIRRRHARWIHWVQDIFPEVATAVSGNSLPLILRPARDLAWRAADHCVVPGADMEGFVRDHGVTPERVSVCQNWAPARVQSTDGTSWRREQQLSDAFVVMYSGNLGRVHDFRAIPALLEALPPASGVEFVFIGNGAQRPHLEKLLNEAGFKNVRFLAPLRRDELAAALSAADLHLITLREGCENLVFPSKLYGIAAVGRPTLVIGPKDCEPSRIVREFGFGDGFTSDEIPSITEFILNLRADRSRQLALGSAALSFSAQQGGAGRAVETWERVLSFLIPLADRGHLPTHSRTP